MATRGAADARGEALRRRVAGAAGRAARAGFAGVLGVERAVVRLEKDVLQEGPDQDELVDGEKAVGVRDGERLDDGGVVARRR